MVINETCHEKNYAVWGVSDQVQHKQGCTPTDGLELRIYVVEGLYYVCSEIKGADQLCGNCAADLRLLFSNMQKADYLIHDSCLSLRSRVETVGRFDSRIRHLSLLRTKYWLTA